MKRIHIMLSVNDLEESTHFYSQLFGHQPSVKKDDYAKWLLDDPSVNFSIAHVNDQSKGIRHLGIQVSNEGELKELYQRIDQVKGEVREEGHTVCCYAQSEKSWVMDPQGIEWEAFHTYGEANTLHGEKECCDDACCS